ncbi:MAG TPA: glycosyltransferase family 2 protein [Flavitalea sp.]|nr:glycosyltransferase family 2 protein [Flavitalea sp.]
MKISIITATFNSAKTIKDTLESVRAQQYSQVEHIIIDGLSSDDTLPIIHNYSNIAVVISEKDSGIYDAMNKGIRLASGDVIGILNSDDMYADKDVLDEVAEIFLDDHVDACYADLQYVDEKDTSKLVRHWKSGSFSKNSFLYGWMPPHPTLFLRRRVYEKVGLFNLSLKTAADYELMLRIFVRHDFNIRYLPRVIVKMRSGGASNASLKRRIDANKEDRLAWKINNLKPYFFTLYLKPIRKIFQFIN